MAEEFIISTDNESELIPALGRAIDGILDSDGQAKITVTKKSTRTLSMNALWRGKWMYETADWMNNQGVMIETKNVHGKVINKRHVTHNDAHEMFVMHWLGCDDENSRELTRDMQKGRMLYLMNKHQEWALEKGLMLTYPSDSEFSKLNEQTVS